MLDQQSTISTLSISLLTFCTLTAILTAAAQPAPAGSSLHQPLLLRSSPSGSLKSSSHASQSAPPQAMTDKQRRAADKAQIKQSKLNAQAAHKQDMMAIKQGAQASSGAYRGQKAPAAVAQRTPMNVPSMKSNPMDVMIGGKVVGRQG